MTRYLLLFALALPAHAQSYLVEPDLPTALARSQAQCAALNCDGILTRWWWNTVTLSNNQGAIVIQPGTPFDVTTTNLKAIRPTGLTAQEQSALQSALQIAPLLPVVVDSGQLIKP